MFPHIRSFAPSNYNILYYIPDLNLGLAIIVFDVDINRKMRIDVSHLVLVPLGDTCYHVLDEGLDGPEGGDILSESVVKVDLNNSWGLANEADVKVLEVLGKLSAGSGDGHSPRKDLDLHYIEKRRRQSRTL